MKIIISRICHRGQAIDGTMFINGKRFCDTAENATACLPEGFYRIVRHKCRRHDCYIPLICPDDTTFEKRRKPLSCRQASSRKCRFCPRIARGNGIYHRFDGAILVGTHVVPGCLKHSRAPYERFSERVRKLSERGTEILLTIQNSYV